MKITKMMKNGLAGVMVGLAATLTDRHSRK